MESSLVTDTMEQRTTNRPMRDMSGQVYYAPCAPSGGGVLSHWIWKAAPTQEWLPTHIGFMRGPRADNPRDVRLLKGYGVVLTDGWNGEDDCAWTDTIA